MTEALAITSTTIVSSETSQDQFAALIDAVTQRLAETSRRVYANTYRQWWAFALSNDFDCLDLSYEHIAAFLNQSDIAYATCQSWKTHMLGLLDWLEESDTVDHWYAKQRRRVLKFLKVKRMESERGRQRSQRALSRTEVVRLLDVWAEDPRPVAIRNTALLRLMI